MQLGKMTKPHRYAINADVFAAALNICISFNYASVAVVVNVVITGVHHPYCRTFMTSTLHGVTAKKKLTWLLEHSKV